MIRIMKGEHPLIGSDPEILGGKPCVRGTRLSVEFLLEVLASGASQSEMLESFPTLTKEGLEAALLFAAEKLPKAAAKAS